MPAMPRPSKRACEIAYKILGVPPNMESKKTPEDKKIDETLASNLVRRVR